MAADSGNPDPRAGAGSPRYRRAIVALLCAAVATFAQVYSPQGLLPAIAQEYGISASSSSLAVGATTIGLAVGMLLWGRLSDRIGRVAAMRWAVGSAVVVGLVSPFMPTFETFIGVRFIEGGLLAGLPAIGVTALAETVTPRALGGAVGAFVGGNTIGGMCGRILATTTGETFGWQWGMFAVALLAALAGAVFFVLVPPTALPPGPSLPLWRATLSNLRTPGVMAMVAQAFLLMGGFVAAYNYLAFRLQQPPFGLTLAQTSWLFLAYLSGAVASNLVWKITARTPPVGVLLGSTGAMLAGLGMTLLPWLPAVVVGLVLFTMGFFGAHSIALGLVGRRAEAGGRSLAPSLYNLAYYAGSSVLGWAGGVAFAAGAWGGTATMVACAALLAAVIAWAHAARAGGIRGVDG